MRHQSIKILFFFVGIYVFSCVLLTTMYHIAIGDLLVVFLAFGLLFPVLVWRLAGSSLLPQPKVFRQKEIWVLLFLLLWVIGYTTVGIAFLNRLLPQNWFANEQKFFFVVLLRKLLVFVLVPFGIYKMLGYESKDFGLRLRFTKSSIQRQGPALLVLSAFALLFEYFFSGGAEPLRKGIFSTAQLLKAVPLCFAWLLVEAGLVEEFFFRALLQSRLAAAFKSERIAIAVAALLFGLAHVPGLYLRSGGSEGMEDAMPLAFRMPYCIANMSLIAVGFGILWAKTRNLYLVMVVHAMFDLLPNLPSFIKIWNL